MVKLIFTLILISSFPIINMEEIKGDLLFSQVLFRHGDRTPIKPYPNDPWNDLKYWPVDFGQLTNKGKCQLFDLGIWLRERYKKILNSTYSKNLIYIQSTDVDRTKMSALSLLAGLYPPKGQDLWNPDIKWQPIPVHTIPRDQDKVLAMKINCPAYNLAVEQWMKSDENQNLLKKYNWVFEYLTKHSGKTINSLVGIEKIYNTLHVEALNNKTLPEWTNNIYNNPEIKALADFSFALATYTRQMARLKSGLLLIEIFSHMEKKIQGKLHPNRSLWIYSAHDTTVANLLNSLKLFEYHSPPYTACIMIELRIYKGESLVSIFYKNTTAEPKPMYIQNCGIQCSLKNMKKLYADVLPKNWDEECNKPISLKMFTNGMSAEKIAEKIKEYERYKYGLSIIGITICFMLMLLLFSCIISCIRKERNQRGYREII